MPAGNTAQKPTLGFFLALGIVLNVFIPKGGFYLAGVPLTWGYLILLPTTLWGIINLAFRGHLTATRFIAFLSSVPFISVAGLTIINNGALQFSFVIALLVSFLLLPFTLYIALDDFLPRERLENALRFVSAGFLLVAIWGIIGFIFAGIYKVPLDIPFVTTGGGSALSSIDRNNFRGTLYKLTATFNNGNIYGICALMALPIASKFLARWKTNVIKLSIILTLSRSAWAGFLFYEIGYAIFVRRRKGSLKYLLVAIAAVSVLVFAMLSLLETNSAFLFSTNLGGRLHTYQDIGEILPFSVRPYTDIDEIIYPSILSSFGYLGLGAFFMAMLAPILLRYADPRPFDDLDRAIILGMVTYLMMGWADGALLYIPTMFFYFSLATALLAVPGNQTLVLDHPSNAETTS